MMLVSRVDETSHLASKCQYTKQGWHESATSSLSLLQGVYTISQQYHYGSVEVSAAYAHILTLKMQLGSFISHTKSSPPNFQSPALVRKIDAGDIFPCTRLQSLLMKLTAFCK